jgi:hypothetical protein
MLEAPLTLFRPPTFSILKLTTTNPKNWNLRPLSEQSLKNPGPHPLCDQIELSSIKCLTLKFDAGAWLSISNLLTTKNLDQLQPKKLILQCTDGIDPTPFLHAISGLEELSVFVDGERLPHPSAVTETHGRSLRVLVWSEGGSGSVGGLPYEHLDPMCKGLPRLEELCLDIRESFFETVTSPEIAYEVISALPHQIITTLTFVTQRFAPLLQLRSLNALHVSRFLPEDVAHETTETVMNNIKRRIGRPRSGDPGVRINIHERVALAMLKDFLSYLCKDKDKDVGARTLNTIGLGPWYENGLPFPDHDWHFSIKYNPLEITRIVTDSEAWIATYQQLVSLPRYFGDVRSHSILRMLQL